MTPDTPNPDSSSFSSCTEYDIAEKAITSPRYEYLFQGTWTPLTLERSYTGGRGHSTVWAIEGSMSYLPEEAFQRFLSEKQIRLIQEAGRIAA